MAPEYSKAATLLKSSDPPVPLAKVDCTSEDGGKDICSEYGVSGYPTLKIFKSGEFAQEYQGPREADGIAKYMRSQVGPASKEFSSFNDISKKIKESKEVVILGVFKSSSDDLYKTFQKTADKLRESVNFVHVFTDSASGDVSSIQGIPPVTAPQVLLVRPAILSNKFEAGHVVYDDSGDLTVWVRENYHGFVGVRSQSNMDDFKTPLVVVFYDVDYVKNPKGTNYWRNRVLKIAKAVEGKKINFAISNSDQFAGEIEEFGLKVPTGKEATPVVGARDADGKKYVMNEKFSVEALQTFVDNFLEGKLEPHVKSEDLPEDNSGPVKTVVGKNFDELVTNSDKDVLIEFCKYFSSFKMLSRFTNVFDIQTLHGVVTARNLPRLGMNSEIHSKKRLESPSLSLMPQPMTFPLSSSFMDSLPFTSTLPTLRLQRSTKEGEMSKTLSSSWQSMLRRSSTATPEMARKRMSSPSFNAINLGKCITRDTNDSMRLLQYLQSSDVYLFCEERNVSTLVSQ